MTGKIYKSILDTIGNTPLVEISKLSAEQGVHATIFLKLEFFNPGGSVKDRPALSMIETAEKEGLIKKDTIIIEPTSGNTGIGLAMACARKGYKLIITMPENASIERQKLMVLFGAEVINTPEKDGIRGSIAYANELLAKTKNSFMPMQFANKANPAIHAETTAKEIWEDLEGNVDVVVSGVGTGGTLTGIGETLKKVKPSVHMVAVEPTDAAILSGSTDLKAHKIPGIGTQFIPEILNRDFIDEVITITNEEAHAMALLCPRSEGIAIGISGGAALEAAFKLGRREEMRGKNIVVIIPSCAERYLSLPLYSKLIA